MAKKVSTLEQALDISKELSPTDQLRLISLLSERLRDEIDREAPSVDMLSLAGMGAELWQQIDISAYLDEERSSWED